MITPIGFFLLLFAVMTASVAFSKNRLWPVWGFAGFMLPVIGLIWVACLPKLKDGWTNSRWL